MGTTDTGARVFEVDEVVSALERVIADHTRMIAIRGEVVNLRPGRDGRMFWFRLEDPRDGMDARVDCFAWATDVAEGHVLEDGRLVQAVARPEFSRRDGRLIVRLRRIEPAGEGEILRMIDERRRRLAAEGLFDAARKRPLPFVPRGVGLITAAGGAARADVLRRIEGRFPVPMVVVHAAMQGPACADEVVRALAALDADARVDVILLARGGGSLQDLLPFSDEAVVRAVRACATPVVAGIGHEPDVTLACLAADASGATPTAAADLVVPDRAALAEDVGALGRRLTGGLGRLAARARRDLDLLGARPGLLRPHEAVVRRPRERVLGLGARLHRTVVDAPTAPARHLATLRARRERAGDAAGVAAAARLALLGARRVAGDPTAPLDRGFALVRDATGRAITSAAAARQAREVDVEFADGTVPAIVREEEET
jgi:exodeoxyribonuclease VII large subunit